MTDEYAAEEQVTIQLSMDGRVREILRVDQGHDKAFALVEELLAVAQVAVVELMADRPAVYEA